MSMPIPERDIYELSSEKNKITWVRVRWRTRKFCLENNITIILDNTTDKEWCVRFWVPTWYSIEKIESFLKTIIDDSHIELVLEKIKNPVLSKLNVNDESRYNIDN